MDSESEYGRKFQKLSDKYEPFLEKTIKILKGLIDKSSPTSQHQSTHLASLEKVQQLRKLLLNKSSVNSRKISALEELLEKIYQNLKGLLPPVPLQINISENEDLTLARSKLNKLQAIQAENNIKDVVSEECRTNEIETVSASKCDELTLFRRRADKATPILNVTQIPLEPAPQGTVDCINTSGSKSPQPGCSSWDAPNKSNQDEARTSHGFERANKKQLRDKISIRFTNPVGKLKDVDKSNEETRPPAIESDFYMYDEKGDHSKITSRNDIQIDLTEIEDANEDSPDVRVPHNSDTNELPAAVSELSKEQVLDKTKENPFYEATRHVHPVYPNRSSSNEIEIPLLHERTITIEKPKENVDLQIEVLNDLKNDILGNLPIPGIVTNTPTLHEPKVTKVTNVQNIIKKILITSCNENSGSSTLISTHRWPSQSDHSTTATQPSGRTESPTALNRQCGIADEVMIRSQQVGKTDIPTTSSHQVGRANVPTTPSYQLGISDIPMTLTNQVSRADVTSILSNQRGINNAQTTPSHQVSRADVTTIPSYHLGVNNVPTTPSYQHGINNAPMTPSHQESRADVTMTPSYHHGINNVPMTPSHQESRADVTMTPSYHHGINNVPMTPNHQVGRADVTMTPSYQHGINNVPMAPSHQVSRTDVTKTPSYQHGINNVPTTPNHQVGRADVPTTPSYQRGINNDPMTPSHQFSRTDNKTTVRYQGGITDVQNIPSSEFGSAYTPMTPIHQFSEANVATMPNHQFGNTDVSMAPSHHVSRADAQVALGHHVGMTTNHRLAMTDYHSSPTNLSDISNSPIAFSLTSDNSDRGDYPNKHNHHSERPHYSNPTSANLPVMPGQFFNNSNNAFTVSQPVGRPHASSKMLAPNHIYDLSQAMINSPDRSAIGPDEGPKDPRVYRSNYCRGFVSSHSHLQMIGSQNYFENHRQDFRAERGRRDINRRGDYRLGHMDHSRFRNQAHFSRRHYYENPHFEKYSKREHYHQRDDPRNRNLHERTRNNDRCYRNEQSVSNTIPNLSPRRENNFCTVDRTDDVKSRNQDAKQNDCQPKSPSSKSATEPSHACEPSDKRFCEEDKRLKSTREDILQNGIDINNTVKNNGNSSSSLDFDKNLNRTDFADINNDKNSEMPETKSKKADKKNEVNFNNRKRSRHNSLNSEQHIKPFKIPKCSKPVNNNEDISNKQKPAKGVELDKSKKVSTNKSDYEKTDVTQNSVEDTINLSTDKTLVKNKKDKHKKTQDHEKTIKRPNEKNLENTEDIIGNQKLNEKGVTTNSKESEKVSATKSSSEKNALSKKSVMVKINMTTEKPLTDNNKDKQIKAQVHYKSTKKLDEKKPKNNTEQKLENQKVAEKEETANVELRKVSSTKSHTGKKGISQKGVELETKVAAEKTLVENNKVKHSKNRKHEKASKTPSEKKLKEKTANDKTYPIRNVSNIDKNVELHKSDSTKNDTTRESSKKTSESQKSSTENNDKMSTEISSDVLSSDIKKDNRKKHSKQSSNLESSNSIKANLKNTHKTSKDKISKLPNFDSKDKTIKNKLTTCDSNKTQVCDKLKIKENENHFSDFTSSIECIIHKTITSSSLSASKVKTSTCPKGDDAEEIKRKRTENDVDKEVTKDKNNIETGKKNTDHQQEDTSASGISTKKNTKCNDSASLNLEINPKSNSEITSSEDCYTDKHYCFLKNKSSYSCRLCIDSNEEIEDIVAHINQAHPESEIPLSRMHPRDAEEAIKQSKEKHFPDLCSKRSKKHVCRFCYAEFVRKKKNKSAVELFFEHVIRMHTGEYHVKGHDKCRYNMKRPVLPENFKGQLIGYICEKCNFTQVSFENVRLHVCIRHKSDQNIIPINLAVMSVQEIEPSRIDDSQESLRMENYEQDNNVINTDELFISQRQLNKKLCFLDTAEYIETIFQHDAVIDTASNYKLPETNPTPVASVNTFPVQTTTDAPNQSNFNYHHFRSTESDKKYYECCINGKRNHFTPRLKIKMKKNVQKDHNELWDGHCSVCEMIVAPSDRRHFTDYLDHFFELNHITDPDVEDQPPGTAAIEKSLELPVKPNMNVRHSSEQISFEEPLVTLDEADERASSRDCTSSQVTMPESYENFHAEVMSKKHPTVLDDMMKKEKLVQVYKCCARYCSFTSDSVEDALLHASAHARVGGEGALGCAYCSYDCSGGAKDIVMHVFKQHGGCAFACARCFYRAAAPQLVQAHAARAHPGEAAKVLGSTEATPGTSAEHSNSTMDRSKVVPKYVCPHGCRRRAFYAKDILEHISKRHATETSHSCHVCKESMCSPSELVVHMKTHGMNEYQCAWCLHGADDATRLLDHVAAAHPSKQPAAYVRHAENESDDPEPQLVYYKVDVEIVTPSAEKSNPFLEIKKATNLQSVIEYANKIYESNTSMRSIDEPSIKEEMERQRPLENAILPYMKDEFSEPPTLELQSFPVQEQPTESMDIQAILNVNVEGTRNYSSQMNEKSVPLKKRTVIGLDRGEPAAKKTNQGPEDV